MLTLLAVVVGIFGVGYVVGRWVSGREVERRFNEEYERNLEECRKVVSEVMSERRVEK